MSKQAKDYGGKAGSFSAWQALRTMNPALRQAETLTCKG